MVDEPALPGSLAIHTAMYFTRLAEGWTTIYARGKDAVVVERRLGRGVIVMVADAYPFSNEAMLRDRNSQLLSWTLGGGHEVSFDEAHLGVVNTQGVATLMRKYHLEGLIYSLLVVALLFIWKNAMSLVPPHPEVATTDGPVVSGRDSGAGFVNLLRRGIPTSEILGVCFAEWKKSAARQALITPVQRAEAERLVQQATVPGQSPVEIYRAVCAALRRKR
jgi:hypothetical protein